MPPHIRRYLPSRDIGLIIISTSSKGVISHREAIEARIEVWL